MPRSRHFDTVNGATTIRRRRRFENAFSYPYDVIRIQLAKRRRDAIRASSKPPYYEDGL